MFKAFTTKLSKKRRFVLKNKVFMAACTLFSTARQLFALSCSDVTCDDIEILMEQIATVHTSEFLSRCRKMSHTWNEKKYVRYVVNKHVIRIINYSFNEHINRLKKEDQLRIMNDSERYPAFFIQSLLERFKNQQEKIIKKLRTQII